MLHIYLRYLTVSPKNYAIKINYFLKPHKSQSSFGRKNFLNLFGLIRLSNKPFLNDVYADLMYNFFLNFLLHIHWRFKSNTRYKFIFYIASNFKSNVFLNFHFHYKFSRHHFDFWFFNLVLHISLPYLTYSPKIMQ